MRADASRFEEFESSVASRVGLGAAADYALELGVANTYERVLSLASMLRDGLEAIPGAEVRDLGRERCGIVTFTLEGIEAQAIKAALREQRINVSVSGPSGALLDALRRDLPEMVRASVHYYNSEHEVTQLLEAVDRLS